MPRTVFLIALAGGLLRAQTAAPALELRVSDETVPQGGVAQFKVSLATPRPILSGRAVMNFNPAVFGDVGDVAVHDASGEVYGVATVQGRRLELKFTSLPGGVGRLPGTPVFTVTIPVLPSVAPGTRASVTVDSSGNLWKDDRGNDFSLAVKPGTLTVGGELSVGKLVPGGGLLPEGTVIEVEGSGFQPSTEMELEGVSVSSVRFVSSERMALTLGAPAELTSKRLRIRNPGGEQVEFITSLGFSTKDPPVGIAAVQPVFPTRPVLAASGPGGFGAGGSVRTFIAIQNQNVSSVEVTVIGTGLRGIYVSRTAISLSPGETKLIEPRFISGGSFASILVASLPVRMLTLTGVTDYNVSPLAPRPPPATSLSVDASTLTWNWQIGSEAPAARPVRVCSFAEAVEYTVKTATGSGGAWLSAPDRGRSVQTTSACVFTPATSPALPVSLDPSGLSPGTYTGTVTVTPAGGGTPATVRVTLTISESPFINADVSLLHFNYEAGGSRPPPRLITVSTEGSTTELAIEADYQSGGRWFIAEVSGNTTPATLTVTADPSNLEPGSYAGRITVSGPANSRIIPVTMQVFRRTPLPIGASPSSLRFSVQRGTPAPAAQVVSFSPWAVPVSLSTDTEAGGVWLKAEMTTGPGVPAVRVSVNHEGLVAGTYRGSVNARSQQPGVSQETVRIPVTLTVWSTPAPIVVSPTSLEFRIDDGDLSPVRTLTVTSGGVPVEYSISSSSGSETGWFSVAPKDTLLPLTTLITPGELEVRVRAVGLWPGSYTGKITVSAGGRSAEVTLRMTKTRLELTPRGSPWIGSVVQGASQRVSALAPGQLVTLFGLPVGPSGNSQGRVLFDGIAAPVVYSSVSQVNAVVPYEVAGKAATSVEIEVGGERSPAQALPIAVTAPGVFTLDGSGQGAAAVRHQDDSVNGPSNAAARGSVIRIYATGEGLTEAGDETGTRPVARVSVTIGGVEAQVLEAISAPGFGVVEVKTVVPEQAPAGPSVQIVLAIGGTSSQAGVTMAVR